MIFSDDYWCGLFVESGKKRGHDYRFTGLSALGKRRHYLYSCRHCSDTQAVKLDSMGMSVMVPDVATCLAPRRPSLTDILFAGVCWVMVIFTIYLLLRGITWSK